MGANSKIEWTHHTFSPWIGCSKVSAGCANCYAEEMMDKRYGRAQWGPNGTRVRTSEANWKKPLQWDKAAAAAGERHRVFCASLADVFELKKSELIGWRADLFHLISLTPNLDWLLLTKRPENISPAIESAWAFWNVRSYYGPQYAATRDMLKDWEDGNPPPNIWIGTSVENQEQADIRIPELLKIPAKVRFLSMEPLLGPVTLQSNKGGTQWIGGQRGCGGTHKGIGTPDCPHEPHHHHDDRCKPGIDWVIVGGESGHNARPMHPDWARSVRDQCQAAGVPFFFKQWGEWAPHTISTINAPKLALVGDDGHSSFNDGPDEPDDEFGLTLCDLDGNDGAAAMAKVGKHAAGRDLDGRTWDEVPEVTK